MIQAAVDAVAETGTAEVNFREYGLKSACENSVIKFMNVEKVKITNLNITHYRYWSMVFHYSSHVQITNIDFYGPYHWRNQDGIDLRNGCSHFFIENLTGVTGDDVVALTNLKNYREELMKDCRYDDFIHNVLIKDFAALSEREACGKNALPQAFSYCIRLQNTNYRVQNPIAISAWI